MRISLYGLANVKFVVLFMGWLWSHSFIILYISNILQRIYFVFDYSTKPE